MYNAIYVAASIIIREIFLIIPFSKIQFSIQINIFIKFDWKVF